MSHRGAVEAGDYDTGVNGDGLRWRVDPPRDGWRGAPPALHQTSAQLTEAIPRDSAAGVLPG